MTPDWLATEDGKRAVEEIYGDVNCACDRACITDIIQRALPHLDRMFRERYAAALEATNAFHSYADPMNEFREQGWLKAASFLRREPTL